MKKFKKILAIILISSTSIFSQTKQELIKELFVVMRQDSMIQQMGKMMVQTMMMQKQMAKKAHPEMISKSTERLDQIFDANEMANKQMEMMKRFVKEDLVDIYDKHFSVDEIKDYIRFHKTPSGQKFLKESPKLQNETMMIFMQKYMPEIKKDIDSKVEKHLEKMNK